MKLTKSLGQEICELYAKYSQKPSSKQALAQYGDETAKAFKDIADTASAQMNHPDAIVTFAYGRCVTRISHPPTKQQMGAIGLFHSLKPLFAKHQVLKTDISFLDASIGNDGTSTNPEVIKAKGAEIRNAFLNANVYQLLKEYRQAQEIEAEINPKVLSAPGWMLDI